MNFWAIPDEYYSRTALIDASDGLSMTYLDLDKAVEFLVQSIFRRDKQLIFLFCNNRTQDIIAYLAALRAEHAVLILESKMEVKLRDNLISVYQPDLIIEADPTASGFYGYNRFYDENGICVYSHDRAALFEKPLKELGVLLSTSGTTGSPKLVRLAYRNVQANAASISEYLSIDSNEVAITSLPMSYSYGLSVINSHLLKGAAIICTSETMAQRKFWDLFKEYSCTSFAGVPYNYQILMRIGFKSLFLPSLRTMTQAGGRLSEEIKKYFIQYASQNNARFFVMYGQTEATARISYVPPERLANKLKSIGIPIPGGKLSLKSNGMEIKDAYVEGELIYEGPNVMLGYADSRSCLIKGDELQEVLSTGDIAHRDEDGYYYITGRIKRFLKLFGLRLNLDDIEKFIENQFSCFAACTGDDDKLVVLVENTHKEVLEPLHKSIVDKYRIHGSVVKIQVVQEIPVTSSGKKDYLKIKEMAFN
jgi:acyl-coenzyme A synthetase/AMP-(fatty) acid ligase